MPQLSDRVLPERQLSPDEPEPERDYDWYDPQDELLWEFTPIETEAANV